MRIAGERIVLRSLVASDAESLQANANDFDIARYTTLPHPYKMEHAEGFIKMTHDNLGKKTAVELGIELDGSIIGMTSLMKIDPLNRNAELGYWLGKAYWRRGLMKEALKIMLSYGFGELGLVRIYAKVLKPNIASSRLLEDSGFMLEGHLRRSTLRHGEWMDDLIYAKLHE